MSETPLLNPNAPALRQDGTLKDASELVWFNSPSDEHPINYTADQAVSILTMALASFRNLVVLQEPPIPAPMFTTGVRPRRARKLTEKAAAAAAAAQGSSAESDEPMQKGSPISCLVCYIFTY